MIHTLRGLDADHSQTISPEATAMANESVSMVLPTPVAAQMSAVSASRSHGPMIMPRGANWGESRAEALVVVSELGEQAGLGFTAVLMRGSPWKLRRTE